VCCDTSAGFAVEGWLNGVVEARRKVRVPFERGLLQILALTKYREQHDAHYAVMPCISLSVWFGVVDAGGKNSCSSDTRSESLLESVEGGGEGGKVENSEGRRWRQMGRPEGVTGTNHSPLPAPREESLRPLPLESRFWPAAAEAKLDVN
jgi:hypothetical protein